VTPRILVAGIGNIFFRDDGFGPAVAAAILAADAPSPDGVRVVDYGIRGMHLTYDLMEGYDALVLIDAMPGQQAGAITVLEVGPDDLGAGEFDAHGMQPVSVLASFATMGGELPPTYVVGRGRGRVRRHGAERAGERSGRRGRRRRHRAGQQAGWTDERGESD